MGASSSKVHVNCRSQAPTHMYRELRAGGCHAHGASKGLGCNGNLGYHQSRHPQCHPGVHAHCLRPWQQRGNANSQPEGSSSAHQIISIGCYVRQQNHTHIRGALHPSIRPLKVVIFPIHLTGNLSYCRARSLAQPLGHLLLSATS